MNSFTENPDTCPGCELQENMHFLRETEFFSQLPLEILKVFAYLCNRDDFRTGDIIFQQHEPAEFALYTISGTAELLRTMGGQERVLRTYGERSLMGGLALLGKIRHLYSLRAATDISCLILTRDKFTAALKQFPDLKPKITQALIQRIVLWEERLLNAHADSCPECTRNLGVSLL